MLCFGSGEFGNRELLEFGKRGRVLFFRLEEKILKYIYFFELETRIRFWLDEGD
jgi:hypothetical protein